jgi:UDP-N-acetylmuramoyl-tripeptide--D-alanyl-D-alanine ligase
MNPTMPHVTWTAADAAAATAGRAVRDWQASGVSIDTRTLVPGDLFVAIQGPAFDGHDFVAQALKAGAAAALVARLPEDVSAEAPLLVVEDTLSALEELGRAARDRTTARVIGVTGSVGKTGTKEALRLVLGEQGSTSANLGSLNNHWGLPLSLARLPADSAYGIFEMGMNHPGEIRPMSRLARPHVALITAIEAVHGAFFASVDEIADAKAEIFDGMEQDGTAVLNRDNPFFDRLAAAAKGCGIKNIVAFGGHDKADARLIDAALNGVGSTVTAEVLGQAISYRLGVPGRHWVSNSLGVLATVAAAGGDVATAAGALENMQALKGRGQRHDIRIGDGVAVLMDESYNASPASMRAAFEVLSRASVPSGGRRITVLGDMLELGDDSPAIHAALAEPLADAHVDLVFAAGPHMGHLWKALPDSLRGAHVGASEDLAALVVEAVRPGDVLVVKGSAGSRTGLIVQALLDLGADG